MTIASEGGGKKKTGVGPSGWCWPFLLGLKLALRGGVGFFGRGWPFLLWGGGSPFLFGLELALCGGVGPSFLGSVLLVGLAFPLGVEGWPFLLAVGVAPWGWGWPFLLGVGFGRERDFLGRDLGGRRMAHLPLGRIPPSHRRSSVSHAALGGGHRMLCVQEKHWTAGRDHALACTCGGDRVTRHTAVSVAVLGQVAMSVQVGSGAVLESVLYSYRVWFPWRKAIFVVCCHASFSMPNPV